jgi:hypothetical protein
MKRIIWQYWEKKGVKPLFVDELYEITKKNSNVDVVLVTPETINEYIPDIPKEILDIEEMAHKADMIRALLVYHHGGMWLDSDAIVLSDLNWLFDMLSDHDFIGFNNSGTFNNSPLNVRINCFLSRPQSNVMKCWVESQHKKFPKTTFAWTEVGTDLLDPIVMKHKSTVKLLPFDMVCPIKWNEVERFSSTWENSRKILRGAYIVMLSNKSLQQQNPKLARISLTKLSEGDTLMGDIIKKALDASYVPPTYFEKIIRNIKSKIS